MTTVPLGSAGLPAPDTDSLAHSKRVAALIAAELDRCGGTLPFARFMELALYAPGLGYYSAGARKFGPDGDFVTAPEISPDFGRCVARALAPTLASLHRPEVLEFGAGSGRLAVDLMRQWCADDMVPERYCILEPSPDLRSRQQRTIERELPALQARFAWLDRLPDPGFRGVVIANEVLDAMPVARFRITPQGPYELHVRMHEDRFLADWAEPANARLSDALTSIEACVGTLPVGMTSEVNLNLAPWLRSLADCLTDAAVLLIDYGYTVREYYHPERMSGTLVCHFRHRVHDDALLYPGIQDISASVDFSRLASAAAAAGFVRAGYTTQAAFLLDAGLEQVLADVDPGDIGPHLTRMQGIKKLTLPGEMGERFKVLALTIGDAQAPAGFALKDLGERL